MQIQRYAADIGVVKTLHVIFCICNVRPEYAELPALYMYAQRASYFRSIFNRPAHTGLEVGKRSASMVLYSFPLIPPLFSSFLFPPSPSSLPFPPFYICAFPVPGNSLPRYR